MLGAHAVGFRISAIRIPRWPLASGIWALAIKSLVEPSVAFGRRPSAFGLLLSAAGLKLLSSRRSPWGCGRWCSLFSRWVLVSTILALVYESLVGLSLAFGIRPVRFAFAVLRCAAIFGLVALTFGLGLSSFRQLPVAFSVLSASLPFALGGWTCAFGVWCWPLRLFQFCL